MRRAVRKMSTSKKRILVATHNTGKLRELTALFRDAPFSLVSLSDIGIDDQVEETGMTLEENASLKANIYGQMSGMLTLADDSGLEVDALGGAPGVYSSRYSGRGSNDAQLITHLLKNLWDMKVPEKCWTARFRCVIAIRHTSGTTDLYSGECRGRIIANPKGENGFGYDPVFFMPEIGKTMAELRFSDKNRCSHRGEAVRRAILSLKKGSQD